MKKRGLSNILPIVILVIIAIFAVFASLYFVLDFSRSQGELAEARRVLANLEYNIDRVYPIYDIGDTVNLTISRGSSLQEIKAQYTVTGTRQLPVDVVFLMDTTGSMKEEINDTKNIVSAFAQNLNDSGTDFTLALVEFKDYPTSDSNDCGRQGLIISDFSNKTHQFNTGTFTTNSTEFKDKLEGILNSWDINSGDDHPESHLTAINSSLILPFRSNAKKVFIMLTDAPPHAEDCNYSGRYGGPNVPDSLNFSTIPQSDCYEGPRKVQDMTNILVDKNITYFMIAQSGYLQTTQDSFLYISQLCSNRIMSQNMTNQTGGKFFNYTEGSNGVQTAFLEISQLISESAVTEYQQTVSINYLLVRQLNLTDSYDTRIENPPENPYETGVFEIDIVLEDVRRIEIYPVITISTGEEVIGPLVDAVDL